MSRQNDSGTAVNGCTLIFNIERDPREGHNISMTDGWIAEYFIREIGKHKQTLKEHPSPAAPHLTKFADYGVPSKIVFLLIGENKGGMK